MSYSSVMVTFRIVITFITSKFFWRVCSVFFIISVIIWLRIFTVNNNYSFKFPCVIFVSNDKYEDILLYIYIIACSSWDSVIIFCTSNNINMKLNYISPFVNVSISFQASSCGSNLLSNILILSLICHWLQRKIEVQYWMIIW